jgi:SOS response regulatory protein OraA/RecX
LHALRYRDHTTASLEQRLTDRGTTPALGQETVDALRRAGLVDDRRFAVGRAALLASRGAGDLLIAHDLECHGVPTDAARTAIAGLEPESVRAASIMETKGRSPRTARLLAAKGFSEAALEPLVADLAAEP